MKNSMDRNDKVFDIILEEAFDKYSKDVAYYEPETEMTEEDIRVMDSKKDRIYNNIMKEINKDNKKTVSVKLIIPLVAILILVVAYSTNTFAFRTFLHQTFMTLTGTDLNVKTKKIMFEDYNNITSFEYKDEIIIPNWLLEGMMITKIADGEENLTLQYKNDDYWMTLRMKASHDSSETKIETENNNYTVRKDKILGMECRMVEIVSETTLKTHMAYWNSDHINYTIVTNIPEGDFNKILENLQYLED